MANLLQKASIVLTPTAYDNGKVLCAKPSEPPYGDFDFSRNSAATRVNAQGLVENVQILSSNLVQNGDFSEEGSEEVSNGSFSQEGVELVTNGDFATDSDWAKGTGWSISGGAASCDGTQTSNSALFSAANLSLGSGNLFKITFNVSNYISGSLDVVTLVGTGGPEFSNVNANGSYTAYSFGASTGDGKIQFIADSNFNGSIDNVSVREVGQDWLFAGGSEITEQGARINNTITGVNAYIRQSNSNFTIGKSFVLEYDVVATNGTTLAIEQTSSIALNTSTVGSNRKIYFQWDIASTGLVIKRLTAGTDVTITNISVKEVGQNWDLGNWSVGDSLVSSGNTSSLLQQPTIYTNVTGIYKTTFRARSVSGASVSLRLYDGAGFNYETFTITSSDFQDFELTRQKGGTSTTLSFYNNSNAEIEITNISVIEITDDTNLPRINYEGFSYQDALGSELVTNGDFENNIDFWAQYLSLSTWDNGTIKTTSTSSVAWIRQNDILSSGKIYTITFKAKSTNISQNIKIWNGADFVDTNLSFDTVNEYKNFTYQLDFSGGGGQHIIIGQTSISIGDSVNFDNVSVKEYLGQEVVPDSGCGSWLWEPQSTNLLLDSGFNDVSSTVAVGYWYKTLNASVSENSAIGVDGLQSAATYTYNGGAQAEYVYGYQIPVTSGVTYTVSGYVKLGTASNFAIVLNNTTGWNSVPNGNFVATAVDGYDNWKRFEITFVAPATNKVNIHLGYHQESGVAAQTDGSVFIDSFQVEQQTYATSYIPTSGSSVTRNQDVCNNGGSLASINSTSGTLYFEGAALVETDTTNRHLSISDGSNNNRLYFYYTTSGRFGFAAFVGGVLQVAITYDGVVLNNSKVACKYKENDYALWVDGVEVGTDTSASVWSSGTFDRINFSEPNGISSPFFGKTKAVAVWKEALSDQELADLTYPTPTDPTFALDFDTIATDFTFARGSEATYVDAQGLIKSTNEIGEELVVNGDFATDTDWAKNGTVTISGGTANFNNSASGNNVLQPVTLPSGKQYIATYEITSITDGKFSIYVGGVLSGNQNNQVGVYTEVFTSIGVNQVYVRARGTTTGSIDNVSVKEYTTATNTPRLDYSTGAEAFLLEPQSTNLVTQSNDFDTQSKSNVTVTSDAIISPDGSLNADKLVEDSSNSSHYLRINTTSANPSVISVFAKKGEETKIFIGNASFSQGVLFDLNLGVIESGSNGTIEDFGNGWYRCSFYRIDLNSWQYISLRGNFTTYQGNGVNGVYLYGLQLEQQSYATSYIPTSGTSVTRNQETCINATPEINSEEGVLYAEIAALADEGHKYISLSDGTTLNRVTIELYPAPNVLVARLTSNNVQQAFLVATNINKENYNKIAIKYKENDCSFWVNGVKVATDTSVVTPIGLSKLSFNDGNVSEFFGNTKDIQVYTKALSDAELIKLTT